MHARTHTQKYTAAGICLSAYLLYLKKKKKTLEALFQLKSTTAARINTKITDTQKAMLLQLGF